jgi:hypothetical protein
MREIKSDSGIGLVDAHFDSRHWTGSSLLFNQMRYDS